jgi:hypothetical protein
LKSSATRYFSRRAQLHRAVIDEDCQSCGNERATSTNSDVHHYVIVGKLLESVFNIVLLFIKRREVQTYLHRAFPQCGCLHRRLRNLIRRADGLNEYVLVITQVVNKLRKFIIIIIWFVRLLALRPLLAYCASLG